MAEHITGLRETVKSLEEFGVELSDLKEAFASIAREGAEIAARNAPSRTGKLRSSIRGNKAKNKAQVLGGSARVQYAHAQNYGWAKRHIRGRFFMQEPDKVLGPVLVTRLEEGIYEAARKAGLA